MISSNARIWFKPAARRILPIATVLLGTLLSGCFGSSDKPPLTTYTIGGTVNGLTGTGLVLQNNGGDDLSITRDGTFTFATQMAGGAGYEVRVKTAPSSPTQDCTVVSGAGNVGAANVTGITVNCVVSTFIVGGKVTGLQGRGLVLQNNAGDDLAISANGSFSFATAVASGDAYAVTVKAQPTAPDQTCTVTTGSGTVTSADITDVAVDCPAVPGRFAYVANNGGDTISVFAIDASGALAEIFGSPFATGSAPYQIAAAPLGTFLYVVNEGGDSVSGFSVDGTSGALTALAGSPFATGTQPQGIAFAPSGAYLYVANTGSNNVSAYAVDATTGALSELAGSPFAAGTGPASVSIDPTGSFALVANQGSNNISVYAIDAASGALMPVSGSPFASGTGSFSLAFGAGGKFVYASTASGGASSVVAGFALNGTTGALTPLSPALTAPVDNYVSADAAGKYLYVAVANSVAVYAINATTGALTAVSGSPYAAGSNAYSAATDPANQFLFVGNDGANTVSAFTIDATTGALTSVPGSPFAAGAFPDFVTVL